MARITVEDCIDAIPNRFELVLLAAERARALGSGAVSQIAEERDKRPVIALREIAEGNVSPEVLRDDYINRFRRVDPDELSGMMLDELDPDARYVPKQDPSWQDGVQAQFDKTEPSDLELSELEPFAVEQATTEPLVADWAYARGGRTVSEAT